LLLRSPAELCEQLGWPAAERSYLDNFESSYARVPHSAIVECMQ
jgi:hypothetical protein